MITPQPQLLRVETVANGWIVTSTDHDNHCSQPSRAETFVFRSSKVMGDWIAENISGPLKPQPIGKKD